METKFQFITDEAHKVSTLNFTFKFSRRIYVEM